MMKTESFNAYPKNFKLTVLTRENDSALEFSMPSSSDNESWNMVCESFLAVALCSLVCVIATYFIDPTFAHLEALIVVLLRGLRE
jgi:hypothetical protein